MEHKICTTCVMDTSIPEVVLDDKGICNFCHEAKANVNKHRLEQQELPWIIDEIKKRGRGREYDVLLGLSGGVDSSFCLHVLKTHNIRVFAFSVDNGWNTPESEQNIMNLVEGTQTPFYRYTIDLESFKRLQRAFIQAGVKNIEIPTDHVLMAATYEMARKNGIKTIISGGNWQTESIMPPSFGYNASDLTHIKAIAKQFGATTKGLPTISLLQYLWYRNVKKIKTINLLDYCEYNREKAIKTLEREYVYKKYGLKHRERKFTKWFQEGYLPIKFGLDKRRPHLSSMIHSGQITREQAFKELEQPLSQDSLSDEISIAWRVFKKHEHSDYSTNEKWVRRWQKFFNILKRYGYSR